MKNHDIEELKKRIVRLERHNELLLGDVVKAENLIKVLLVSGHLDKEVLDKARELVSKD